MSAAGSARLTSAPGATSTGSNSAAVTSPPSVAPSSVNVAGSVVELLESDAMKVPEPGSVDTTTAPSTSTAPSRLLAPLAGV